MQLLDLGQHPTSLLVLAKTLYSEDYIRNVEYARTVIYMYIALYADLILYFRGIHPIKQGKTKAVEVMSCLVVEQC